METKPENRSIRVIVLARNSSRRFPGKALHPIAGVPMLARVIRRVFSAIPGSAPIVATSDREEDEPIVRLAEQEHADVVRGSLDDVASRFLETMNRHCLGAAVRVSGDSPLIDPRIIRWVVDKHKSNGAELTTTVFPRTVPPGCSVEVISRQAIERVCTSRADNDDKEHVTRHMYNNPGAYDIVNVVPPGVPRIDISLTVDNPDDIERIAPVVDSLGESYIHAPLEKIIELLERREVTDLGTI